MNMSEKRITGSIALTKLKHVMMEAKGKSGKVKGIFIPLDANKLVEKDGAVYMNLALTIKEEQDSYGQNGFIAYRPEMGKKWSDLSEDEKNLSKELSPILGNIKIWDNSSGANDSSGAASDGVVEEDSELPF